MKERMMGDATSMFLERRRSRRQATIDNEVIVKWVVANQRETFLGTIINISENGLLASGEILAQIHDDLWIRLREPVQTQWIKTKIVRFSEDQKIGLAFSGPIPYDLILASTTGIDVGRLLLNLPEDEPATVTDDEITLL
jgi:PilZ domain